MKPFGTKPWLVAAALAAAATLSGAIWNRSELRDEAREEAVARQRLAYERNTAGRAEAVVPDPTQGAPRPAASNSAPGPSVIASQATTPSSVARELLDALEAMSAREDLFDRDLYVYILRTLTGELSRDDEAVESVLAEFRRAAGTPYGGMIGTALGLIDDPRVEQTAVDLVDASRPEDERAEGLRLLDRLDSTNPATRTVLLGVIREDPDPRMIGEALYGLGRVDDHPAEVARVTAAVKPLVDHWDPEVRRRAVIALAEWSTDPADLGPVIATLRGPSEPLAVAAAFALGRARAASPAAVSALRETMSDAGVAVSVRERAWRSLSRMTLDAPTARAMDAYEGGRADLLGFDPNAAPEFGAP